MNSFSILRTNVGLTTNVKVVVRPNYKLSLESFDTNDTLSSSRYKNFIIPTDTLYDESVSLFYKDTPTDISYDIKYNSDEETMSDDFNYQYDNIYNYGARNIIDNKNYDEEYEYLAPLYISKSRMPSNFIIFRTDSNEIYNLTPDSFNNNIIKKLKTIKIFDLSNNTPLGEWLDKSFVSNNYFPPSPLDIDFRSLEFSKWNGIDYRKGGFVSRSKFLGDVMENEKEIFELEKFIFNGYKDNEVIFPNIINLSFLFDDTPSTPDTVKRWSINNYFGFYLDELEEMTSISPYPTKELREDVVIRNGNIILSESNPDNPFIEEWNNDVPFYVEYKGEYFEVIRYTTQNREEISQFQSDGFIDEAYQNVIQSNYKIISDKNLEGKENEINKNSGTITSDNFITNENDDFKIDGFDDASVWLIEIDGIYHNIIKTGERFKINTDYSFTIEETFFEYKIAGDSKRIDTRVSFDNDPIKFKIFRLNFTDIKDFDTKIVDTDYSKYEYEYKDKLTNTDESKMYFEDISSTNNPKDIDDFIYNGEVVNIPVSSEYTSNYETFKINDGALSDIWRINPTYCRWGFQNSISGNDKPYLLNNSRVFEDFNRTSNVLETKQNRIDRNLDYFYTFNLPNSDYLHHSLHLEDYINGNKNTSFNFDEGEYLNGDYDYFTYLLDRQQKFDGSSISKNVKKYSYFNEGDSIIPNNTLFRGISVDINSLSSISLNDSNNIDYLNLSSNNEFNNYKFSIICTSTESDIQWDIIEKWKMSKTYSEGDIVIYDDILYISNQSNNISNDPVINVNGKEVLAAPYNKLEWDYYEEDSIFWNPERNDYVSNNNSIGGVGGVGGTTNTSIVYNYNRYYYYNGNGNSTNNIDFWNPTVQRSGRGYSTGERVIFKGKIYISLEDNNIIRPDSYLKKWEVTKRVGTKWSEVEIWNPSVSYTNTSIISHNGTVYKCTSDDVEAGDEPGVSTFWEVLYSFNPSKEISENFDIFKLNNKYYKLSNRPIQQELSNGIKIYINKKWKNVLVNIYIDDNTLSGIRNKERDYLYDDLYNVLTANNFINCINNISDKSGFIDYITYTVIDENGEINNYSFDDNVNNIPYLLTCNFPDEVSIKSNSLIFNPIKSPKINTNLNLKDGNIVSIDNLNWYNDNVLAYDIIENEDEPKVFKKYSGIVNNSEDIIYRYSGYYMPVFYDIELFKKEHKNKKVGNYVFDTSLTDFGLMKERKFRKTNRSGSKLKLLESRNFTSIYPMVDEFGYTFDDFMIFKSTWDKGFHFETVENKERLVSKTKSLNINTSNVGQPLETKIENEKKYRL
jgi:hypothetical protein